MENIFENAKFGDKFRTRDGRMAVYAYKKGSHVLLMETTYGINQLEYFSNGYFIASNTEFVLDIIGKWEEPINEKELDKLANEYEEEYTKEDYETLIGAEWDAEVNGKTKGFIDGFKVGYHKAKEK